MAMFQFKCPQCGQTVETDESSRGQVAECPHCGKGIVVPRSTPRLGVKQNLTGTPEQHCDRQAFSQRRQTPPSSAGTRPYQPTYNVQVPNHMVGAILTTLFCGIPGGIVALVYASQVNTKLAMGDVAGAQAASNVANGWIIGNSCFGFGCVVGSILVYLGLTLGIAAAALGD